MFPLNVKPYPQTVLNLAPSRAEQWLSCPLSAVLTRELNKSSAIGSCFIGADSLNEQQADFIQQGVLAHKCAEQLFKHIFFGEEFVPMNLSDEIINAVNEYVLSIQNVVCGSYEQIIYLGTEQLVNVELSENAKTAGVICSGKYDAAVITTSSIHIFDLKYGVNDEVGAVNNAQLMLYAVGMYQQYKHMFTDTINIVIHVYSPRQEQAYSVYQLSSEQLMSWFNNTVLPCVDEIAKLDLNNVMSNPSVETCKNTHCEAYECGRCNKCKNWALARLSSSSSVIPTNEELVEEVRLRSFLNGYMDNSRDMTVEEMKNGRIINGVVCESKEVRGMPKSKKGKQAVLDKLASMYLPELAGEEYIDHSPKPLHYFEKKLGKEKTADVFADVLDVSTRNKLKLAE